MEDANTNTVQYMPVELEPHVQKYEEPAEFHAPQATGCHRKDGNRTKY